MNETREHLRALLPHLDEKELEAACERFQRYIRHAAEIARQENGASATALTPPPLGARVNPGLVDPGTSKNTG